MNWNHPSDQEKRKKTTALWEQLSGKRMSVLLSCVVHLLVCLCPEATSRLFVLTKIRLKYNL